MFGFSKITTTWRAAAMSPTTWFAAMMSLTAFAGLAHGQVPSAPSNVTVTLEPTPLTRARQWTISDDGRYVTAESAVLRLKFAYNAQNYQGWFTGTTSGGGGRDGGIVELYYKPTSPTRNLVFRNGTWGSGYDNMDFFEAEYQGGTRANYDAPDYESGRHAVMNSHSVTENAGRLIARFDFQFQAWRIIRTYIVYPWGDITVHSQITVTQTAEWCFFAHRFTFGASATTISNGATYNWGGRYRDDGEHYHAWSDGAPNGSQTEDFYHYDRQVSTSVNENSYLPAMGRADQYSGFLLDDTNGNDPDIVVMAGEPNIWVSPYQQVSSRMGGKAYIETALFNYSWAPQNEAVAQMTYFYMTSTSAYTRTTWPASIGTWTETSHVLFRRNLRPTDYVPLWKARARDAARQAPTQVTGATARFDAADGVYHLTPTPGATSITFHWTRLAAAANPIDYRTTFVVDQFDPTWVTANGASVTAYSDPATHQTVIVLTGAQTATPQTISISLGK